MTEQEYQELPWSMEETVENMRFLKDVVQKIVIKENLHGKGEEDAKEVAFDFDRAIEALERHIPKKMKNIEHACNTYGDCPACGESYSFTDYEVFKYCPNCGQKIDWSDEEEEEGGLNED